MSASTERIAGFKHGRVPREVRMHQLLDHAERLYLEHGYEGFSIEDLCREAGVSRPIVYEHFGSKHGIFLACVRRIRDEFDADLLGTAESIDDLPTALTAGAVAFFSTAQGHPDRWSLVYGASTGLVGPIADELYELRSTTVKRIGAIIERFAPDATSAQINIVSHMISGAGEELGRWWLRNPTVPQSQIIAEFVAFCLAGVNPLLPKRGRRSTR